MGPGFSAELDRLIPGRKVNFCQCIYHSKQNGRVLIVLE